MASERTRQRWCWVITNPSANQNRPPSPDPYRYFVCVSWTCFVQAAAEVAEANTAEPVFPAAFLHKESPSGEWVLIPMQALLSAPTQAMPFARPTGNMAHILDHICDIGPFLDIDNWPGSTIRTEWFRLTRDLIQNAIADMELDPHSLSQIEEAFISVGLLGMSPLGLAFYEAKAMHRRHRQITSLQLMLLWRQTQSIAVCIKRSSTGYGKHGCPSTCTAMKSRLQNISPTSI